MEKIRKSRILSLVLLFTVIFQSGHAFQTIIPQLSYAIYFPALLGLLLMLSNRDFNNLKKPQNAMVWIFILMVLCTFVVNLGSGLTFYIYFVAMLLAAYCIVTLYSFEVMAECYLKIMTITSLVALVGYYLVNNTSVLEVLPSIKNTNDVEYGVGIIFNYIRIIPERNCGMFWEPGLFATYLTIATIFELLIKEKASLFRLVLFSVCMITANSSAGFVLLFLCLALLLIRKESKNFELRVIKNIFSIFIIVAVVFVVFNSDSILLQTGLYKNEYFQKLLSENIADSSRSNAILHNLKIFATDPIFGAGYTTVMQKMNHVADTSTSTFLMSIFGIFGILYTAFFVYGIMRIKRYNLFTRILVLAMMLIIINKEPHHMILFTWILLLYLMKGFEKRIEIKACN